MAIQPTSLSAHICEQLTTERLLALIGVEPDDIVTVGDTIKCCCPVCKTQAFKTLFLNSARRTFGCRYTRCSAHGGGDYVELIALMRDVSPPEAIRQLIRELGIEIDDAAIASIGSDLKSQGLEALSMGDLKAARRLLEEAASASQSGDQPGLEPEVMAKLAHCCWELDDVVASRAHYLTVIEQHLATDDHHNALLLISDLIHVDHEWAPELHLRLGRLLAAQGDTDQGLTHLIEAAEGLGAQGNMGLAQEALSEAREIDPDSEGIKRSLFVTALARGDWDTVLPDLEAHLEMRIQEGALGEALDVLARMDTDGRLEGPWQTRRLALLLEAGMTETADVLLEEMVRNSEGDRSLAKSLMEFLAEHVESRPQWDGLWARLLLREKQWVDLRAVLDRLLTSPDTEDHQPLVKQIFKGLRDQWPEDLDVRRRHLDWLADHEDPKVVLSQSRALLQDAAEAGDVRAAEAAWRRLESLAGEDLHMRGEAIQILWRLSPSDDHREAWRNLIDEALENRRFELTRELGRAYVHEVGLEPKVAVATLDAAQSLGSLAEDREIAEHLAADQRSRQDWDGAVATLRRLVEVLPADEAEPLWETLADTLEKSGQADAATELLLVRAENALREGRVDDAEGHLKAAKRRAKDTWVHWRAVRALATRTGESDLHGALVAEALAEAEKTKGKREQAIEALMEEAAEARLSPESLTRLLRLLCRRGDIARVDSLVASSTSFALGQGAQNQAELVEMLRDMPQSASLWSLAINRINDEACAERLRGVLETLANTETIPTEQRLDLLLRASQRWPDEADCLSALAACQSAMGLTSESASTRTRLAAVHLEAGEAKQGLAVLSALADEGTLTGEQMRLLAKTQEAAGLTAEASSLWCDIAELELQRDDEERVRGALDNARRLGGETPKLLALEFSHCEQALDSEGAEERAIALAKHHESEGDQQAALDLLRDCVEKFGETSGLLWAQAETLSRAGEDLAAVRTYRTLLDRRWERGNWEQCAVVLDRVQEIIPDCIEDLERRAELAMHLGRPDEAARDIEGLVDRCLGEGQWLRATELLKRLSDWVEDPRGPLQRIAEILNVQGERAQAVETLRRVLDISFDRGELEAAEPVIESLWQWVEGNLDAQLGLCGRLAGRWSDERLVQRYVDLAHGYRRSGNLEAAAKICESGLSRWREQGDLLWTLADVRVDLGQESGAAQCLRTCAEGATKAGDAERAIKALRRVIAMEAGSLDDRWALVGLLARQQPPASALEQLQWLVDHHQARGENPDLIRALEKMVEIEPNHLVALTNLAETCAATGDVAGATRRWLDIADIHLGNNRRAPAERAYHQILVHDPDSVAALEGLFNLYEQQQNPRKLVGVARRLLEIHAVQRWESAEALHAQMAKCHADADEFFLRWADILWDRGKREEAIAELEMRAETLREAGRHSSALDALNHLLLFLPDRLDLAEKIAGLAFELGDTTRARRAWKEALAGHRALGDIDSEHRVLQQLHRLDPEDLEVTEALAKAAFNLGLSEEALDLHSAVAARHRQNNDPEAQRRVLLRILEIDSDRPQDHRALAELMNTAGETEKAVFHMRRALALQRLAERWDDVVEIAARVEALDPEDTAAKQLRGEALAEAGRRLEAIEVFIELGTTCQSIHDYLMAEMAWRAVIDLDKENLLAREQLASIMAAQGQGDEAVVVWTKLAEAHRRAKDIDSERQVLVLITGAQPDHREAHHRLAQLSLQVGDVESAWLSYRHLMSAAHDEGDEKTWKSLEEELLTASPDPRLRIELAQLHLEANHADEALALYAEVAEAHRRADAPRNVHATCQLMLQIDPNHRPALEMLIEVLPALGDLTGSSLLNSKRRLAKVLIEDGELDRARILLEDLHATVSSDLEVMGLLARLHMLADRRPEFEKMLDKCAEVSISATARGTFHGLCDALLEDCPWPRAVRERLANSLVAARMTSQRPDVFADLAANCAAEGDIVRAAEVYQTLLAALPKDTRHRLHFIDFLIEHGQHTRAVHELIGLAEIYRDRSDPKREVQCLERARDLDPENAQVLHHLGQALLSQNARGRALEHLKHAANLAQQQGHLGTLTGLYETILEIDAGDVTTRRALVDTLLSEDRTDEAIAQCLTLADQCVGKGFLDLAAQCYRSVVQIDPSNLEAWQCLVNTHLQFGAEEDLLPDYIAIARIYQGEGRHREAVQWYRRYLNHAPGDIAVRKEFIETYLNIGSELDLIEEYRVMAELCHQGGHKDEAKVWEQKVGRLRERVAKSPAPAQGAAPPRPAAPGERSHAALRRGPRDSSLTAAGASRQRSKTEPGIKRPRDQMVQMLDQYLMHLEGDPRNVKMRLQVGEILHHLGREEEAYAHRVKASEILYDDHSWADCIAICERLLRVNPNDPEVQERLDSARLGQAQMRIIDSAIDESKRQ